LAKAEGGACRAEQRFGAWLAGVGGPRVVLAGCADCLGRRVRAVRLCGAADRVGETAVLLAGGADCLGRRGRSRGESAVLLARG
jgi:hypothetical protein